MDCRILEAKLNKLNEVKHKIPFHVLEKFERAFDVEYTHESTTIEGNTLTLIETKLVLEDKISVGGKTLRELHEVINHDHAFQFVRKCISEKQQLNEEIIKEIHATLMNNIIIGGIYRNVNVRITGSRHIPPFPDKMYNQLQDFFADLIWKKEKLNPIELAAWTHAEFVKIHPFPDGNGRTSRLIMNYQLMGHGFLPISIKNEDKLSYFNALETYHTTGDLTPFTNMIGDAENKQIDAYLDIV